MSHRLHFAFGLTLGLALLAMVVGARAQTGPDPQAEAAQATADTRVVLPGLVRTGQPDTFAYTVQPGDTLFSVAQRFDTTVAVLVALNAIADAGQIDAGDVYFIPEPSQHTGSSVRVEHGPRDSNMVALTFDMGGRVEPALAIMQFLIDNNVRATIFPTGAIIESVNTDVGRQVLQLVDQHPDLFDVGNHSYSHPDFRDLTVGQMETEIATTDEALAAYTSVSPRPFFRPPFGGVNQHVLDGVGQAGYRYTVMWDIDTIDWLPVADGGPTTQQIVNKVVGNADGGSIVLMHLGGYNTLAALPAMVEELRARGFEFARLTDMLGN